MLINVLFYEYFKKNYIRILSFVIIISLINPLQSVVLSRLYGKLFDIMHQNKKFPSFFEFKNILKGNMAGIMMVICIVYIIIFLLYMSKNYLETIIVPDYFKYVRTLLFSNFIKKYSNDYKDVKTGEVLSKIFELNMAVIYLFINLSNYFLATIVGLFAITCYYLYLDINIGFIFLVAVCGVLLLYYFNAHKQIDNSIQKLNILYKNNEDINDRLSNLLNIYINNEQNNEINKFIKNEFVFKRQFVKNYWIEKKLVTTADIIIVSSAILILIVSYYSYKNKRIDTVGLISIIVTLGIGLDYLFQLNGEVSNSIYQFGIIKSNESLLNEILDLKKRDIKEVTLITGKIEFKNVVFGYDNKKILKNFNYTIKNKEKVAIMGRSGSGKTTIMKLLIDLHEINSGEILVDGVNIKNIDTNYLREKIIYINQKTVLFNRTIIENMKYGTDKNDKDVYDLLNKYELMVIFNKLPNSIKTNSGVNGNNLSMGMQKIVMLVRGILKDGIIYIFDEPLTSLDSKTRNKVINMLMGELKDKTLLVITHDKEILPHMTKLLQMNNITN